MPGEVQLLWDIREPGVSQRVERSDGDNLNFTEVANLGANVEYFKEQVPDNDYWYRVRTETSPGVFTGYSNETSITIPGVVAPSSPIDLTLTPVTGPAVLFEDTFDGPAGTKLLDHTPDIGGSYTTTGNGTVDLSNELNGTGGLRNTSFFANCPWADVGTANADCRIDFTVPVQASWEAGVCPRNSSTTTGPTWRVLTSNIGGNFVVLQEDGSSRGSVAVDSNTGDFFVICQGQSIEYGNDSATETYALATQNETVGQHSPSALAGELGYFKVTELP